MGESVRLELTGSDAQAAPSVAMSFEAFFEQEKAGLYSALCLVTRNRHEAEDLTQEAFIRLLERWEHVGTLADPRGYLYRTAMNAFRRRYRRTLAAARRSMNLTPSDDAMAEIDERDVAVRALAGLSERQRAAVVLTDLLGFRSQEAAKMLGIRASTIRMHLSRAHANLRETMSRE
jgi:RNA polymerase sigma-70 factor (ECF subfamily)